MPSSVAVVELAWRLHQDEEVVKWCLEAALLAGETFDEAAHRCGLGACVAESYARLFFDIIDKLHARDYVIHRLLPRRAWLGFSPVDTATMLKVAALIGGPRVLDVAVRALTGEPVTREQILSMGPAELLREVENLHCRLCLLLRALPLSMFRPARVPALQQLADDVDALFVQLQEECRPDLVEQARVDALAAALGATLHAGAAAARDAGPLDLGQRLVALHEAVMLLHDLAPAA
jgi:hypothetical protein